MGFITRNLKRKGIKIGIILILIGICSGAFAYWNAKPNINNITYENIPVVAEKIDGIGEETLKAVVDNQPYEDMAELKRVVNVGEKRYNTLKHHFDTHDICRIQYFWIAIFIMVASIAFGANWMAHVTFKKNSNKGDIFKAIIAAVNGNPNINREPNINMESKEDETEGKRFKRK